MYGWFPYKNFQWTTLSSDLILEIATPSIPPMNLSQITTGNEHNTQQQGPRGRVLQAQFYSEKSADKISNVGILYLFLQWF